MHELALTESIVEMIEEESRSRGFAHVRVVRLEIGALSHVEPEAIRFCFEAVARGGVTDGARLEIITTPGEGWCLDCGKTVVVTERFGPCPDCGGYHVQVTGGEDMRVKELEVD
ncbi:hydrogenase maturation nickel metallochaperone HypA [Methylosinus sp. Sm6]|uniref:hydrogenase maturation nickel metallochaperone HypA n=1 Tax=Methylosinus sp. Sm6 TaxID=2866948 RepID=UPI001C991E75|nr:hydrogenase maturation nickel metallochaperone HypA [Methylosinus sp. Sm6]MBY6241974.1 hydrogenase maturation nickel metallochaperone HypA [Methylosinus sp. Sm6]